MLIEKYLNYDWTRNGICSSRELERCEGSIQPVRFRRHNEIVAVEPPNLVCPPSDCHFAPFGQEGGMMSPTRLVQAKAWEKSLNP
jgi:hypothetical protein